MKLYSMFIHRLTTSSAQRSRNTAVLRSITAWLTVATLVIIQYAPLAAAQGILPEQQRVYDNDIQWYDLKDRLITNCTAGSGTGAAANINVAKGFSLGTDAKERRVNLMKALIADYKFTPEQAAGIVGNFMWESGGEQLPPDFNQGDTVGAPPKFSGGYGWAQWTGSRQKSFIAFAISSGYMASNQERAKDDANYAYLKLELNGGYKGTVAAVQATGTPETAAAAFEKNFEAAGTPAIIERQTKARSVYIEFNGGDPTTPPGAGATTTATPAGGCNGSGATGAAAIVGENAFPLITNKSKIKNRTIFANGTTQIAGHPYTAYDILVDPGTPIVAFLPGVVTSVTEDRCPGRMISVYNKENDLTISYLHMDYNALKVKKGDTVTLAQQIDIVGPPPNGCGTPHLHIDAAKGQNRPGCSRLNCPAANAAKFVDIGPQLYTTYQKLPE